MTQPTTPNQVLRTWREDHGLTRSEMAGALNGTPTAQQHYISFRCHPTTIAAWENGHTRWPSTRYQAALHDLTGHTPTELGFTKPPPSPPATPSTPHQIRDTTHTLLTGTELHITETTGELIITNPDRPDRGHVAISLDDGYVSWSPHPTGTASYYDHYGHLESITTSHDDDHTPEGARPVPALMIIHLLTATTG